MHVRDKDLFKYLGCFIAIVAGYMVAWTAVNLDYTRFDRYGGVPPQKSSSISGFPRSYIAAAGVQESGLGSMLVKGRIEVRATPQTPTENLFVDNVTSNKLAIGETEARGDTSLPLVHHQYFLVCRALSWDIVVEIGEFVFKIMFSSFVT